MFDAYRRGGQLAATLVKRWAGTARPSIAADPDAPA